jgi:hypothetical protein
MTHDRGDAWDGAWAVISLVLGEATAFLTVYPTLYEVPGFTREGLAVGFGLLLSATYFLMGTPCVNALQRGFYYLKRKLNGSRKTNTEES